jgi:hypothetical protein
LQQHEGELPRGYDAVHNSGGATVDQPYAFRAMSEQPKPEMGTQPEEPGAILISRYGLPAVALVCVLLLLVFAVPAVIKPKPPALYVDLGSQRLDPAGLSGYLIAQWKGSAAYHLSIDTLDPQRLEGFRAVAVDPPYPLSVVIHLKDDVGRVVCQKEILLPVPQTSDDASRAKVPLPDKTPGDDTVQYVAGEDGKVVEIALDGALPCTAKAYRRISGWDFTSNFPLLAGQSEWLKHENALEKARKPHRAPGAQWRAAVQHLPAPIEGDDVITGNNPSRGTVDTSGGRVFLLIKNGTGSLASEWQIFPTAIHFFCDKKGFCILSCTKTHTTLQARLLK